MLVVQQTDEFRDWIRGLIDRKARGIVRDRLLKIEGGNLGKARSLGDKVSEIKIDYGPGYRLYFTKEGLTIIVLLCGGDKGSQRRDIKRAKELASEL